MKKSILISIMILWFKVGSAQVDCLTDTVRYSYYTDMEILNPTSGKYEKFIKNKKTNLQVTIESKQKIIKFLDKSNNYNKKFIITGCLMSENFLTYLCVDQDNNRKCELQFSTSNTTFDLVVTYTVNPIVYKVSRIKNTN